MHRGECLYLVIARQTANDASLSDMKKKKEKHGHDMCNKIGIKEVGNLPRIAAVHGMAVP